MSFFALGRLKNHKVPHLHPNSTMFMPLDRLQLKMYAFSRKFNVCSIPVLLDMADDRDEMEASGTRAPRALGHLVFLLINFSDVCSNFISFLRGRKGSGTRVFGQ